MSQHKEQEVSMGSRGLQGRGLDFRDEVRSTVGSNGPGSSGPFSYCWLLRWPQINQTPSLDQQEIGQGTTFPPGRNFCPKKPQFSHSRAESTSGSWNQLKWSRLIIFIKVNRIDQSPKYAENASYHSVRLVSLSSVCVRVSMVVSCRKIYLLPNVVHIKTFQQRNKKWNKKTFKNPNTKDVLDQGEQAICRKVRFLPH